MVVLIKSRKQLRQATRFPHQTTTIRTSAPFPFPLPQKHLWGPRALFLWQDVECCGLYSGWSQCMFQQSRPYMPPGTLDTTELSGPAPMCQLLINHRAIQLNILATVIPNHTVRITKKSIKRDLCSEQLKSLTPRLARDVVGVVDLLIPTVHINYFMDTDTAEVECSSNSY